MKSRLYKIFVESPHLEYVMLFLSLVVTFSTKIYRLESIEFTNVATVVLLTLIPDLSFILFCIMGISLLYYFLPKKISVRISLIFACAVLLWSICNYFWVRKSGVQLQPGMLFLFIKNFREFLPLVGSYLASQKAIMIILSLAVVAAITFVGYKIIAISPAKKSTKFPAKSLLINATILAILTILDASLSHNKSESLSIQNLSFSSHAHAISSSIIECTTVKQKVAKNVSIPLIGQRKLTAPKDNKNKPNVVVILLESVSYKAFTNGEKINNTPTISKFANNGMKFTNTYVLASHTTKAIWSTLTSVTPSVAPDYLEAIPMEKPYESLITILSRNGYRSAFFEMSKGSFECGPGLAHNLGFDWAWFRENLEQPDSNLGYMSGDDCKLIDPATKWMTSKKGPFILTIMTAVSHDPFVLPKSFGKPVANTIYGRYLQTINYTDHFVDMLYKRLEELNLAENTLICILGDHGTSFRNKDSVTRWHPYDEVVRVPWIIYWPNHIEPKTITALTSQLDVTPSILSLLGWDVSKAGFEGKVAYKDIDPKRKVFFSSWYKNSPIGSVEAGIKTIYYPYMDSVIQYNLITDPNEEHAILNVKNKEEIKKELTDWQTNSTKIEILPDSHTEQLFYKHWKTSNTGDYAWAYYVKQPKE